MDIVKMVWYCSECDREFTKKEGERHRYHSDHTLQRYLKGIDKRLHNEILSKDDVNHKSEVNIGKQVLDNYKLLRQFLDEEREWQENFLKWIRQQKQRFKAELS